MLRVFVATLDFPETETSHVLQLGQRMVLFEPVLAGCRGLYWTTLRPTNTTTAQEGFPCMAAAVLSTPFKSCPRVLFEH